MDFSFKAFRVTETDSGSYRHHIESLNVRDLPDHEVLVRVHYSSLNYKDALSATIHKGITRTYPHTPGIDAAGEVVDGGDSEFKKGDPVIVTSYDLGMNTPGGFGEYLRVPPHWIVPLPAGLTLRESMILGTAGFTAALSLHRLQQVSGPPEQKSSMIITGATGGVGSLGVCLAQGRGYRVTAVTGQKNKHAWVKSLGASEVIGRKQVPSEPDKPLLPGQWEAALETVGGTMLERVIRSMKIDGAVSCCGNVGGDHLSVSLYPFILRGVSLLGIDSAHCKMPLRSTIWEKLANDWKPERSLLNQIGDEIGLEELSDAIERLLKGKVTGRIIVRL